jgi:hypothetical protein
VQKTLRARGVYIAALEGLMAKHIPSGTKGRDAASKIDQWLEKE